MGLQERLKELIKDSGITEYAIAKIIGIPRSTINNYTNGRNIPTRPYLNLLANYFNVRQEWLKTGEGPKYLEKDLLQEKKADYETKVLDREASYTKDASIEVLIMSLKRLNKSLNEAEYKIEELKISNNTLRTELAEIKEKYKDCPEGCLEKIKKSSSV